MCINSMDLSELNTPSGLDMRTICFIVAIDVWVITHSSSSSLSLPLCSLCVCVLMWVRCNSRVSSPSRQSRSAPHRPLSLHGVLFPHWLIRGFLAVALGSGSGPLMRIVSKIQWTDTTQIPVRVPSCMEVDEVGEVTFLFLFFVFVCSLSLCLSLSLSVSLSLSLSFFLSLFFC